MKGNIVQTLVCRLDDLSGEIREMLASSPDHTCCKDGIVYSMFDQTVICLPDEPGRNELISVLTRANTADSGRPGCAEQVYQKTICDPDYHPDSVSVRALGIRYNGRKCAVVFRAFSLPEKDLCSVLKAMSPVEDGDTVVSVDYQTAVLIKNLEGQSEEEIREFTEAVIGTLEAEGISDIRAGIGQVYGELSGLRNSFLEGKQALDLGTRYHRQDQVFVFADQTLERIVDSIPKEKKKAFLKSFFGDGPDKTLSGEMLETIRVFFQNDLNLTAASKQLYIHRNTLNYRLDKIRKEFGLDLRSFRDAVIFRIISEITNETQSNDR